MKEQLKTNKDAQEALARLKGIADIRITKPLNVPVPQKNPDGTWMYPGDFPVTVSPFGKPGHASEVNAIDIVALAMLYQLSGDEKYGEFAKNMILAYADGYNQYGHPKDWVETRYRSAQDGRLSGQFLEDGGWLNRVSFGYDLVRSLPSFTPAQQKHVHDDLFVPVVAEFLYGADKGDDYLDQPHNRSAMCAAGTLMAGYATEDEAMVNEALYGPKGSKDNPGGITGVHFGEKCLLPDGLWLEGAPGYQTGILSCALFNDAQTLWHHGIDMYRYRNGALKRMLDSSFALAYPDDKLTIPALHDSATMKMLADAHWLNGEVGMAYEYGYLRYKDPRYIPIVNNAWKGFEMTIHAGAPSWFQDLPTVDAKTLYPPENVNFYCVGYGVFRLATPSGCAQVLMEYGPNGSHSHPSKLGIDVFALGQPLLQFPGVIFPYNDPLDQAWFNTTASNCTVGVDEKTQIYSMNWFKFPRGTPHPFASQLVYGSASTMGIQRAWSNTIFTGTVQDRALFFTPEYIADIFGNFSNAPHKYDLFWHIVGDLTTTVKSEPFTFDPKVDGYNSIQKPTKGSTDQAWTATVTTPNGKVARFVAAGSTRTDLFFGIGPNNWQQAKVKPPAVIIQRRDNTPNTLFGNAIDISGAADAYVKSAEQEGSLDAGYGLLKVDTQKGIDLCFSAYRPGTYKAGGLETDAMQAMVRMDGANVQALYLGGGTKLTVSGGAIQRSEPGLAYVEKTDKGTYIAGNPSPADATITVTLPALVGLKASNIDDQDKKTGDASVKSGPANSFMLSIKAGSRVEFGP